MSKSKLSKLALVVLRRVDRRVLAALCLGLLALASATLAPAAQAIGADNTWVSLGEIPAGRATAAQAAPLYFDSKNVLFATDSGGVFRSTDGGSTFARMNNGLGDLRVSRLAVSPRFEFDMVLLASTPTGFYRSSTGGQLWTKVVGGLPDAEITGVAFSPNFASDQAVFAATKGFGLYRSNDAGLTWASTGTSGFSDLNYLGVQIAQGDFGALIVLIWTESKVYRSNNSAGTWTERSSGLPGGAVIETLVLGPNFRSEGLALLGTRASGLYRTGDGGASWAQAGLTDQGAVAAIAFSSDFGSDSKVFAGVARGGFFLSSDAGQNWTAKNTGLSRTNVTAISVSNGFRGDRTIFAGGGQGGFFKSTTGGDIWQEPASGLNTPRIQAIGFSNQYAADGVLLVATQGGVFRSSDRGTTWTDITWDLPQRYVRTLGVSPNYATDATIVIGLERDGIYRTFAGSSNRWTQHNQGIDASRIKTDPRTIVPSPTFQFDLTVFAGGAGGLARSLQAGTAWTPVGATAIFTDVNSLAISPVFSSDKTVFAGTHGAGVYKTTTGGDSWTQASNGLSSFLVRNVAVSPSYAADRTVLAATDGGLFISKDAGQSWTATALAVPATAVAFAPNFASSRMAFAASGGVAGRVYQSLDGGLKWSPIETGLPSVEIVSLAVSPGFASDANVFAGTGSAGLWVYKVAAVAPTPTAAPQPTPSPSPAAAPKVVASTFSAAKVVANLFVVDPSGKNADLRHNIPDLQLTVEGKTLNANFKTFYEKNGALERWGLPISEVFEEEKGVLTQYYQRGAADFHKRKLKPADQVETWILERRLTWDYVGGGAGGSVNMGVEPTITNTHDGTLLGDWGHKISDFDIAGKTVGFRKFFDRLGGSDSFGYPKTDARQDTGAAGTLLAPGSSTGRVRQYFQAAVFEYFPDNPEGFKVQLTLLGDFLRNLTYPGDSWAGLTPFQRAAQVKTGDSMTILSVTRT